MEFIIESDRHDTEHIDTINPYIKPLLDELLRGLKLASLDYFVIANSEEKNYAETVMKYASLVGTEAHITQDGTYFTAGKSLIGIDQNAKPHQAIVIKSSIWVCAALEYLSAQGQLSEEFQAQINMTKCMSLALIFHEVGHAVDHENQYNMFGVVNTKVVYDLRYEYDEYIKNTSLSLWGEYYAETFAYQIIRSKEDLTSDKETELVKCIMSYSLGTNRNALLERVYRILYYFIIRLAFIHQHSNFSSSFDYRGIGQIELVSGYIPFLVRTEKAILNLHSTYPKWDSYDRLNDLSTVFKDLLNFEHKRQTGVINHGLN